MDVTASPLAGVLILKPKRLRDARGFFCESYHRRRFAAAGIDSDFVQDNLVQSGERLTLRGLHFQTDPCAQAKLVGVVSGAALDVVVDLRASSPTFGRHFALRMSADDGRQLFVPTGFAHGYLTLEPDTLLTYKVSHYYAPEHEEGIRFDDVLLGIDWGAEPGAVIASDRDRMLPGFDPKRVYFA